MSRRHPSVGAARRFRRGHAALPPLRIERPPRMPAEHEKLRAHCREIVATLQGRLLSRKQIELRAEAMANEAIREANQRVREPVRGQATVIVAPPAPPEERRSPGGLILP